MAKFEHKCLDRVDASIDPCLFFKNYVSTRTPVVIQGLLTDPTFKANRWTDLDYLSTKAGHCDVSVEPMHPETHQFGTSQERLTMPFHEFINSLRMDQGQQHHYLTTQYAAENHKDHIDTFTHYPSPTHALKDEFPSLPTLTGNLVLQQVNLWIGRSKTGSSSGLHHDFHDNLYCLLLGHKRFVLFPPHCAHKLDPVDVIAKIFPNGLIEYEHSHLGRADSLRESDAVRIRAQALEQRLENATGEEKTILQKRHHEAMELMMHYLVHNTDEPDDFDNLDLGIEEDDLLDHADIKDDDDEQDDDDEEDASKFSNGNSDTKKKRDSSEYALEDEENPSSFSKISVANLHKYLGLPTTAVAPSDESPFDLSDLDVPFVVDLNPGEMLYLPASWWHEVTSSSTDSSKDHIHMAFNYWFYPPDGLKKFEEPYEDDILWSYLRSRVKAAETTANGKRSRGESVSDDPSGSSKKVKQ